MKKETKTKIMIVVLGVLAVAAGIFASWLLLTIRPQPLRYGDTNQPLGYGDTNHLYWKDIDVVVTSVEHKHWLSGNAHCFSTKVTVWSEEYQLKFTDEIRGKGKAWNYRKGDTVQAELLTWKNNETGEINRRLINRVYG